MLPPMFEFASHPTYERAELAIDFLIVGGGLAGMACALGLRRAGHRVVVLEQCTEADRPDLSHGGVRLPPNVVKILYKWGFKDALKAISIQSRSFEMNKYETGEALGTHVWVEDIFTETGGAFLFCHHADLRRLLRDAAAEAGAEIRASAKAVSVDCDACQVTLSTGMKLRADVIVGADGGHSFMRQIITGKDVFGTTPSHCLFYNTTIPLQLMQRDPTLVDICSPRDKLLLWLGHNAAVAGFHMGGRDEYALHIWVKPARHTFREDEFWAADIGLKELQKQLGDCEPRLLKLSALANPPARVLVKIIPALENWVHHSGRVIVIGEAAHPLPAGSIQGGGLAMEDSASLAKLFSHLRSEDQIPTFLHALQDLREGRCASVVKCEQGNLLFQMMPDGPQQKRRDTMLRRQVVEGRPMPSNSELLDQWEQVKELFAYDPEDQADDWWIKWGLLRERAKDLTRDFEKSSNPELPPVGVDQKA